MTCRMMAAGQQKKRLTSASLHEQCKGKKKTKVDSCDFQLHLKSHVDLQWDEAQKRVISKKEQIGISWRALAPFVNSILKPCYGLADVISIPPDVFSSECFSELLSYEVWASCLSQSDRKFLAQFLPSGIGAEEAVYLLLEGDNHHFGNPYLKWSASLSSGAFHPDAVLGAERELRADKRTYYTELHDYHNSMIGILKEWRECWLNCDDPDNFLRMRPSRSSESSSKACLIIPNKETPQKPLQNVDVGQYISYIKVSRDQYDLVKSMKSDSDGIHPRLLCSVLGDMKNFEIHTYEKLLEDEENLLCEHWSRVLSTDISTAFEVFSERKITAEKLRSALVAEITKKIRPVDDEREVAAPVPTVAHAAEESAEDGDFEDSTTSQENSEASFRDAGGGTSDENPECIVSSSPGEAHEPADFGNNGCASFDVEVYCSSKARPVVTADFRYEDVKCQEAEVLHQSGFGSSHTITAHEYEGGGSIHGHMESFHHTAMGPPATMDRPCENSTLVSNPLSIAQKVNLPEISKPSPIGLNPYFFHKDIMFAGPSNADIPSHMIGLESDIMDRSPAQRSVPAQFHMGNKGPSLPPTIFCPNQGPSEQIMTGTAGFAGNPGPTASFPVPPALRSINGMRQPLSRLMDRLPDPAQFSSPFQQQMILLEQRRNGLHLPPSLPRKNTYPQAAARFPNSAQQLPVAPFLDGTYNWFPTEQSLNGIWASAGVDPTSQMSQCLLGSSSLDGSLLSILPGRNSSSNNNNNDVSASMRVGNMEADNYVSNFYGYGQNQVGGAAMGSTASNMLWTAFPHQNHDPGTGGQHHYQGPWNHHNQ